MWRTAFLLGVLTGLICALAVFLRPVPRTAGEGQALIVLAPGNYRLAGEVENDTCGVMVRPWPVRWEVTSNGLYVGERHLHARAQRTAVVYEAVQRDARACLAAAWVIKLAPRGEGFVGTATLDVTHDGANPGCTPPPGIPCSREARIAGYPIH